MGMLITCKSCQDSYAWCPEYNEICKDCADKINHHCRNRSCHWFQRSRCANPYLFQDHQVHEDDVTDEFICLALLKTCDLNMCYKDKRKYY